METLTDPDQKAAAKAAERLPAAQKWFWAVGGLAENFVNLTVLYLAMQIYNLGLSTTLVGLVMALPRLTDAIVDPLVGNLSDNTLARWGRRRPFIAVGALLVTLFYVLMWWAPVGLSERATFLDCLATTVLCFCAYATFGIPFNALGLEMTGDYHERTCLQSIKFGFMITAQLSMSWLYPLCFQFGKLAGVQGGKPEVIGAGYVALIYGAVLLVSALLPALVCRERAPAQAHEKISLLSALKLTAPTASS